MLNIHFLIVSEFDLKIFIIVSIPSIIGVYFFNSNAYSNFKIQGTTLLIFKPFSIFRRNISYNKDEIRVIKLSDKKILKWGHPIVAVYLVNGKVKKYHSLNLSKVDYDLMILELRNMSFNVLVDE